jgi:predicted O-methyltransferase YrrM
MTRRPPQLDAILQDTTTCGFTMPSDELTGAFLCALAASKPSGRLLELGTGTGLCSAWMLHGMDDAARLDSVENDKAVIEIANRHLGHDHRFKTHLGDGADFLANVTPSTYDLVFADAWPGKYSDLGLTISALAMGGLLVFDDMLPQPNWPDGHGPKAASLRSHLLARHDVISTSIDWSTGLILAVKRE